MTWSADTLRRDVYYPPPQGETYTLELTTTIGNPRVKFRELSNMITMQGDLDFEILLNHIAVTSDC